MPILPGTFSTKQKNNQFEILDRYLNLALHENNYLNLTISGLMRYEIIETTAKHPVG